MFTVHSQQLSNRSKNKTRLHVHGIVGQRQRQSSRWSCSL